MITASLILSIVACIHDQVFKPIEINKIGLTIQDHTSKTTIQWLLWGCF